jgi:hypothetical protein
MHTQGDANFCTRTESPQNSVRRDSGLLGGVSGPRRGVQLPLLSSSEI